METTHCNAAQGAASDGCLVTVLDVIVPFSCLSRTCHKEIMLLIPLYLKGFLPCHVLLLLLLFIIIISIP